jgi:hypothetical protein
MRISRQFPLRIALAVGLTVGPLFTWFVANLPNAAFGRINRHAALGSCRLGALGPAGPRGDNRRGRHSGNHVDGPKGGNRVGQMGPTRV